MYTKIVDYNYIDSKKIVLKDNSEYKCRFCGETKSTEDFKKVAHAVSECLGNKTLITEYECDDCNFKFSKDEEEIAKLFHLYKSTRSLKKKKGTTKFGHGADIRNSESEHYVSTDEFDDDYQSITKIDLLDNRAEIMYISDIVVNLRAVYRCLLKYALSVIPEIMIHDMELGYKMLNNEIPTKVDICYGIFMNKRIKNQTIKIYKMDAISLPKYFAVIDTFQVKYVVFLDFKNDLNWAPPDFWLESLELEKSDYYKIEGLNYSSEKKSIHQKEIINGKKNS